MPYEYILANLLVEVDGAVGALFLDDSGETVDLACSEHTPYQMRILGAYLGIYMRQLGRVLDDGELGVPALVHIEKEDLHIYASPLPDGYYLVLVQRQPSLTGPAQRALRRAAIELEENIFTV